MFWKKKRYISTRCNLSEDKGELWCHLHVGNKSPYDAEFRVVARTVICSTPNTEDEIISPYNLQWRDNPLERRLPWLRILRENHSNIVNMCGLTQSPSNGHVELDFCDGRWPEIRRLSVPQDSIVRIQLSIEAFPLTASPFSVKQWFQIRIEDGTITEWGPVPVSYFQLLRGNSV